MNDSPVSRSRHILKCSVRSYGPSNVPVLQQLKDSPCRKTDRIRTSPLRRLGNPAGNGLHEEGALTPGLLVTPRLSKKSPLCCFQCSSTLLQNGHGRPVRIRPELCRSIPSELSILLVEEHIEIQFASLHTHSGSNGKDCRRRDRDRYLAP